MYEWTIELFWHVLVLCLPRVALWADNPQKVVGVKSLREKLHVKEQVVDICEVDGTKERKEANVLVLLMIFLVFAEFLTK